MLPPYDAYPTVENDRVRLRPTRIIAETTRGNASAIRLLERRDFRRVSASPDGELSYELDWRA